VQPLLDASIANARVTGDSGRSPSVWRLAPGLPYDAAI
jgi:hypothetical protein